jgi:hypothetical protein
MTRRKMSEETKAKISAAKRGIPKTAQERANMSKAKMTMSDETKAKLSAAKKGRPISDETRKKRIGIMSTVSARANMSAAQLGKPKTQETKDKMSKASKGRPKSMVHRAAMSAAHKGIKMSPEVIDKMVATRKTNNAAKRTPEQQIKYDKRWNKHVNTMG